MESLTAILTSFVTTSNSGIWALMPYARNLVLTLAIIDTVYTHLINLENGDHIHIVTWNLFKYGFCYFLIGYYHWLIISLLQGFIEFAFNATGNTITVATLTDPTYILQLGAAVAAPLNQQLQVISELGGGFGQQMNLVAITMGVQLSYIIIAIQVFISYAEFYIMGALCVVLLPFLANIHTRFIGDRVIPLMMGISLKIAVLSFILSLALPYIQTHLPSPDDITAVKSLAEAMDLLACSMAFAFLTWRVPNMAAKVMNGSGSGVQHL
jgi:type IV secretion system protein TrbL